MDFAGRMETTAKSGVCKGAMVQTPNPPTKKDRDIREAESGVCEGDIVQTPTHPTKTDRDSGEAELGCARGPWCKHPHITPR